MRVIRRINAVLIGFVFFLAGILKLMDPVGARLVVEEYLKFLHLNFLMGGAGFIGSGMALLEALVGAALIRSEEHTSELQSPVVISYAVFCLKKKK